MSKLFANRSALTAAALIIAVAAVHSAAAQERGPAKDESSLRTILMPSTAGAAPRQDSTPPVPVAKAPLPEMHIMDYSMVFPETAEEQAGGNDPPPENPR
jgi:hypothetical protein